MLIGQYLGRRHDTGLETVVNGYQHAHEGHYGFAAAYIALQQAVHLYAALGILPYFLQYLFLRIGEAERQLMVIKFVEIMADTFEYMPPEFLYAEQFVFKQL